MYLYSFVFLVQQKKVFCCFIKEISYNIHLISYIVISYNILLPLNFENFHEITPSISRDFFMKLGNTKCLQTSTKETNAELQEKIKRGWVKHHSVGNQDHFADFDLPRNEDSRRKENPTRTSRLIFKIYIGVALLVMFLLQALTSM